MNLLDEEFDLKKINKEKNSKKTSKIILICIILIAVLIIIIMCANIMIKESTLKVFLDGTQNNKVKDMLVFEDDKVYIPIRDIAEQLSYKSYNGDYINKSEETNKCYVETEQEVATFTLGSNKIYKMTSKSDNYEYYYLDEPVKSMNNGKLYTTIDGIEKAFNVSMNYDKNKKRVTIQSMNYLLNSYKNGILDSGFTEVSEEFNDVKAILKNKAIVLDQEKKYGVFDVNTDKRVLEVKYDKVEYIAATGDFLVQSNKKYGIVSSEGATKVNISYDSIEQIDQDKNLYLVEKDKKYGVIDINENIKISIDYDEIGMDISDFEKNEIKNKYILIDSLIPVRKDKLWGLFNISGKQVTELEFDSFGYKASTNKEAENLLVIPEYNVIVACKDKKYGLISTSGEKLWNGLLFDDIYMTVTSTEKRYYIVRNGKKYDAEQQLKKLGLTTDKNIESGPLNGENSGSTEEKNNGKDDGSEEEQNNEENNGSEEEQNNEKNNGSEEEQNNEENNGSEEEQNNEENNGSEEEQNNEENNGSEEEQNNEE